MSPFLVRFLDFWLVVVDHLWWHFFLGSHHLQFQSSSHQSTCRVFSSLHTADVAPTLQKLHGTAENHGQYDVVIHDSKQETIPLTVTRRNFLVFFILSHLRCFVFFKASNARLCSLTLLCSGLVFLLFVKQRYWYSLNSSQQKANKLANIEEEVWKKRSSLIYSLSDIYAIFFFSLMNCSNEGYFKMRGRKRKRETFLKQQGVKHVQKLKTRKPRQIWCPRKYAHFLVSSVTCTINIKKKAP